MNINKTKTLITNPMSDLLIKKYFDGKANIKTLEQISNFNTFDEVMGSYSHCIIFLALEQQNDGHWLSLFINSGNLYYFDSYGKLPLYELKQIYNLNDPTWGQNFNLIKLIQTSKYKNKFYYNDVQYQQNGKDIATCGRLAIMPCILNIMYIKKHEKFDLKTFYNLMQYWKNKMHKNYDEISVFFVNKISTQ